MLQNQSLDNRIVDLKASGLSLREIASQLQKEGFDLSHMTIKRYLDNSNSLTQDIISKREELQEKLAEQQLDIYDQLIGLNKILSSRIESLSDTDEHKALIDYIKETRCQIELISKLLGQLQPQSTIFNNNFIQNNLNQLIDNISNEQLVELVRLLEEKRGDECPITTREDSTDTIRRIQQYFFQDNAVIEEDGKLIFTKPGTSLLDTYRRWKFKEEMNKNNNTQHIN